MLLRLRSLSMNKEKSPSGQGARKRRCPDGLFSICGIRRSVLCFSGGSCCFVSGRVGRLSLFGLFGLLGLFGWFSLFGLLGLFGLFGLLGLFGRLGLFSRFGQFAQSFPLFIEGRKLQVNVFALCGEFAQPVGVGAVLR